jgi:hypothetical protein
MQWELIHAKLNSIAQQLDRIERKLDEGKRTIMSALDDLATQVALRECLRRWPALRASALVLS